MTQDTNPSTVAIIDYGVGNLFSMKHACGHVGMNAVITADIDTIMKADAVILPGVGAFGDAMEALHKLDLVHPLKDLAQSDKPLLGICLGLQLLFSESYEFGTHKGLDIVPGEVVNLRDAIGDDTDLNVPHVGWRPIDPPADRPQAWAESYLSPLKAGAYMYFVHSFFVRPQNKTVILSETTYGDETFCSSLKSGNVQAFQFHPERSGEYGLAVYEKLHNDLPKKELA